MVITWILSALSISGAIFNAYGKRIGFWIWLISNTGWLLYFWKTKVYAQIPLLLFYNAICITGLIKWKQKGIK